MSNEALIKKAKSLQGVNPWSYDFGALLADLIEAVEDSE